MPPLARPYPRFIADSAQESRPYGRRLERLTEAFSDGCASLIGEAGTEPDLESIRFFPERTWGGRTYVPAVAPGAAAVDGATPEFFGHVSFRHEADGEGEGEPAEMTATADFTDVTAAANPDWQVDLNDDVIGEWRGDGGRGGEITLIWGTPLVRGALAATAELDDEVLDQAAVNDGRFTLLAVDAVHGFGDDHFLEIKLWNRRFQEVASESLYADDEEEGTEDEDR
ncbi:MAG TPA: hypothetical protein VFH44_07475 [Solirubrobacterales bacterium]|nr:hypothetical protein [Solirubrobacterales bacterium]